MGLSFFAVLYGLDFIATVPPSAKLTATTFGRAQVPPIFGWIFAAHRLGADLMAFGAGVPRRVAMLSRWLLRGRAKPTVLTAQTA